MIIGVGVRPESKLAVDAGLESGRAAEFASTRHLQTSDPDIYAVGDVIETTRLRHRRADASSARRSGEPAGPDRGRQYLRPAITFSRHARHGDRARVRSHGRADRRVGKNTAAAGRRPYRKVYVHPANHVGYFPGAEGMTLKVMFDPHSGKLLGAQAVGGAGVDKRIDVLSVAIQAGMTVFDLEEMELAYAPQYGAAKDPVNMAGFVAAGLMRDDHPQIDVEYVLDQKPYLLDVRTPEEFAAGHFPEAVNIPVDELRGRLGELRANVRSPSIAKSGSAAIWPREFCGRRASTP